MIVKLKRTFNQSAPFDLCDDFNGKYIRYWRVVGPLNHANYGSDLSLQGLKEWGII